MAVWRRMEGSDLLVQNIGQTVPTYDIAAHIHNPLTTQTPPETMTGFQVQQFIWTEFQCEKIFEFLYQIEKQKPDTSSQQFLNCYPPTNFISRDLASACKKIVNFKNPVRGRNNRAVAALKAIATLIDEIYGGEEIKENETKTTAVSLQKLIVGHFRTTEWADNLFQKFGVQLPTEISHPRKMNKRSRNGLPINYTPPHRFNNQHQFNFGQGVNIIAPQRDYHHGYHHHPLAYQAQEGEHDHSTAQEHSNSIQEQGSEQGDSILNLITGDFDIDNALQASANETESETLAGGTHPPPPPEKGGATTTRPSSPLFPQATQATQTTDVDYEPP
eukprot:3834824-Rhodomonas_salina.1